MDDVYEIPLTDPGDELIGAMMFLATLAYPEGIRERNRAIAAMRSLLARQERAFGRDIGRPPLLAQQMSGQLRRLDARIEKRLEAAELAWRICAGMRMRGRSSPLHPAAIKRTRDVLMRRGATMKAADRLAARTRHHPGPRLTVNEWAQRRIGDWERDPWRSTRPVLHLALALRGVGLVATSPKAFGVFGLLYRPRWIHAALRSGESWCFSLEQHARTKPALKTPKGRVRLVPATVEIPPPAQ